MNTKELGMDPGFRNVENIEENRDEEIIYRFWASMMWRRFWGMRRKEIQRSDMLVDIVKD